MSGCHEPKDNINTHPCSGCGVAVCDCKCIYNNFRNLYGIVRDLSIKTDEQWDLMYKTQDSLSKRISKLEDNCIAAHPIKLSDRVKDIEYRLEHIVALPTELDIRLQDVERQLDSSQGYIKELRERLKDIELSIRIKYPHRCPICEGTRLCHNKENGLSWQCESCGGKGVLWG
jgi:uncharacterized coiled-coil protein SlyX